MEKEMSKVLTAADYRAIERAVSRGVLDALVEHDKLTQDKIGRMYNNPAQQELMGEFGSTRENIMGDTYGTVTDSSE
jgi:hypothetical protein